MRIHYLIHAPFELPGAITDWQHHHAYQSDITHAYNNDPLPELPTFDMLILMGGPQSACHLDNYPYLQAESVLVKKAIADNKAVLGICLGAQIIAHALEAKTLKSPHREVGLYPVELTEEGKKDPVFKHFGAKFDVFHWHNDMPELPDNAVLLAKSAGCPHQAFRYKDRVYGLQFHLELTKDSLRGMIEHCAADLRPGPYIQSKEQIAQTDMTAANQKLFQLLDYLAACVLIPNSQLTSVI